MFYFTHMRLRRQDSFDYDVGEIESYRYHALITLHFGRHLGLDSARQPPLGTFKMAYSKVTFISEFNSAAATTRTGSNVGRTVRDLRVHYKSLSLLASRAW